MALADGHGLPISVSIGDGSRHDVTSVDQTLNDAFIDELPTHLVADKAFDSAGLEKRLWEERRIELIAPVRRTSGARKQDGRSFKRYKRRWKVERLFAWLKRSRRVAVRYEINPENYLGFLMLACILLLLKRF